MKSWKECWTHLACNSTRLVGSSNMARGS